MKRPPLMEWFDWIVLGFLLGFMFAIALQGMIAE